MIVLLAAVSLSLPPAPPATLPVDVYQARRARVAAEIGDCLAVLAFQGRPTGRGLRDSDFFWLTGIEEPDAWLLLAPKRRHRKVTLFLAPRDPEAERWTGLRDPITPAFTARHGVDVVARGKPDGQALAAAREAECVALIATARDPKDERPDVQLSRQIAAAHGLKVVYKRTLLERLRSAHGPEELALLEHAAAISKLGHHAAARATVAGVKERDVRTQIEYAFFSNGATALAYPSIIGSGPHGAILHWGAEDRVLAEGELVVIDAGAEYGRYAADITRTYPVSGKFSAEQAKAYRAVYQAQEDIFAAIKPGVALADLQKAAEDSLQRSGYLEHFIHGFGHPVGLDVHDPASREAPLPVGAVFTVEPGVYLPDRGFGVRIEDQVVITESGYRLMTGDLPRKLEDVEAWVAGARRARTRP